MISWPAVIHYQGDDELTFIKSEQAWQLDAELHGYAYSEDDILIDNAGHVAQLIYNKENSMVVIQATRNTKTISEFEALIKKHMSHLNQCCISKLKISSFHEGILLVESSII